MRKKRQGGLLMGIALLVVLWLVWQKLHFVVWINIPWWGFLLLVVGAVLLLEFALERIFGRDG